MREIAEVIELCIEDLTDPDMHGEEIVKMPTWSRVRKIAFFRVGEHRFWGASYRILKPLMPYLQSKEWR